MKYQLLTGLAAALVLPALSPSPTAAQTQTDPAFDTALISPEAPAESASEPSPETSLQPEATETPAAPSDSLSAATTNDLTPSLVQVIAHQLDDAEAATLYLRNIPLLTFVGAESTAAATDDKVDTAAEGTAADPAVQANTFAERIDQMHQAEIDASTISARWNADEEQYEVMVGDETFVSLNDQITLPDATGNLAEDTLQVTNRLRRLLGDVEPITEIEGRPAPPAPAQTVAVRSVSSGLASWYGPGFHGRRSASGEVFNQNAMTAAHRTLPFGTRVRVTNLNNGRQVIVRINDRGPFSGGRVIDLSAGAAGAIGLRSAGVGPVQIEVLGN
ncbi:MAG: septal ring lytic transglycosylase RlpA family protein [Cyanobacteria bacterium J06632_22]